MVTLRIEHPVTDYPTWETAFQRFSDTRAKMGAVAARVYRPIDDPEYVLIDLDFDTIDQAKAFSQFLQNRVWSSPDNAPALAETPLTRILQIESLPQTHPVS